MKATAYNRWAAQNVWRPGDLPAQWPGAHLSDGPGTARFAAVVSEFQAAHGLVTDGKLGPTTFRTMLAVYFDHATQSQSVLIGGLFHDVPFTVVRRRGLPLGERRTPPGKVVLHVDMTWDSDRAFDVLHRRRLSSHFGVDGDRGIDGYSTVHQWADPLDERTYHAGSANEDSIGVDLNTPLKLEHQDEDRKRRGRARPIVEGVVRGKVRRTLGAFPEQAASLSALAELFERVLRIPRLYPRHEDGTPITDRLPMWVYWNGWLGHYHTPTTHWCPGPTGVALMHQVCPPDPAGCDRPKPEFH